MSDDGDDETDEQRQVRLRLCPRCFKPVDPLDSHSQQNTQTRRWEHQDCPTSPRIHSQPRRPTAA